MSITDARKLARDYARHEMGWKEAEHVGEIPAGAGEVHVFRLLDGHFAGVGVEPGAWGEEEVTSEWDEFQLEDRFPDAFARIRQEAGDE